MSEESVFGQLQCVNHKLKCINSKLSSLDKYKGHAVTTNLVWNENGTGAPLIQANVWSENEGVVASATILYYNIDGSEFTGTITAPSSSKVIAIKPPVAKTLVGDGNTPFTIPPSYTYSIQVIDNDDSANDSFSGGTHQKVTFANNVEFEIPEDSIVEEGNRVDGQGHPPLVSNNVPVGITVMYNYIPV